MKKIGLTNLFIGIAYLVVAGLFIGLIVYSAAFSKVDKINSRGNYELKVFSDYTHEWIEDDKLPCGGKDVLYIQLDEIGAEANNMAFFTIHQNVKVYMDDELIYSIETKEENKFGKTPGNMLNNIPIYMTDSGKLLRIEFIPVYKSLKGVIPTLYLGDTLTLYKSIVKNDMLALAFSLISLVLGVVFIFWFFFNKKYNPEDNSILYIGCFSLCLGFWKLTDLKSVDAFFDNTIVSAQIPLVSLFLVGVPVLCFLRDFFKQKYKNMYNTIIMICLSLDLMIYMFQIFRYKDFRESLIIVHFLFGFIVLIGGYHIIIEVKTEGWSAAIMVAVVCLILCMLGISVDMIIYYNYIGSVTSAFGMIGFLAYVVSMGLFKIRESTSLMEKGRLAKHYQDIAYHDPMTGVYSRAAYNEYVEKQEFDLNFTSIVMLDLNNLKECNDTLGHEVGDDYIMSSVTMISEVFSTMGSIFRIGGDEFCVIMNSVTELKINAAIKLLRKKEEAHNRESGKPYSAQVALGYALFDRKQDYDISDTVRRADKLMYANKIELKKNN